MGKLSWNDLRLIYEGQYGVTADEASKWIARELFSKNYLGDVKKLGKPSFVATMVVSAINKNRAEVYAPTFWSLIMLVIKNIPSHIFKRLDF